MKMRLSDFKELCKKKLKRKDYEVGENEWHIKQLCYCRYRMLNENTENILSKEPVIIGIALDRLAKDIIGVEDKVFSKEVDKYTVYGTPDLIFDDKVVDIKFSMFSRKVPNEHDVMQVRLYMWLLGLGKGELWYISPTGSSEFDIKPSYSDDSVIYLIENPKNPMWEFECRYCSLHPCKYVL